MPSPSEYDLRPWYERGFFRYVATDKPYREGQALYAPAMSETVKDLLPAACFGWSRTHGDAPAAQVLDWLASCLVNADVCKWRFQESLLINLYRELTANRYPYSYRFYASSALLILEELIRSSRGNAIAYVLIITSQSPAELAATAASSARSETDIVTEQYVRQFKTLIRNGTSGHKGVVVERHLLIADDSLSFDQQFAFLNGILLHKQKAADIGKEKFSKWVDAHHAALDGDPSGACYGYFVTPHDFPPSGEPESDKMYTDMILFGQATYSQGRGNLDISWRDGLAVLNPLGRADSKWVVPISAAQRADQESLSFLGYDVGTISQVHRRLRDANARLHDAIQRRGRSSDHLELGPSLPVVNMSPFRDQWDRGFVPISDTLPRWTGESPQIVPGDVISAIDRLNVAHGERSRVQDWLSALPAGNGGREKEFERIERSIGEEYKALTEPSLRGLVKLIGMRELALTVLDKD